MISKSLANFIKENLEYLQSFDNIIIYYDNGQIQLTNIIVAVFNSWFNDNFEYKPALQNQYKLFQTTDLICTLSLIEHKIACNKCLTTSENAFFGSLRDFKKNYLKHLNKKKI